MHVDHPDAEPRGRGDRPGDGIRDVVVLQIEKHAVAARHKVGHERRAVAGEEPVADLEPSGDASKTIGQRERVGRRIDIEGDEQLVHISGQWSVVSRGQWSAVTHSVTGAPVSTVPTRSESLAI